MMISPHYLEKSLEKKLGKKLVLQLNDNRSTFLSVKWEADVTRVSMHRMFLQAPRNIMDAVVCFIGKEHKKVASEVFEFVDNKLLNECPIDTKNCRNKWTALGIHHNLQEIYDKINSSYFNSSLAHKITWFGSENTLFASKAILGLFDISLKLIKVHRVLDSLNVPSFVVEFVVYHEALHSIYLPKDDELGCRKIHTSLFKEKERQFHDYFAAKHWIQKNKHHLFK